MSRPPVNVTGRHWTKTVRLLVAITYLSWLRVSMATEFFITNPNDIRKLNDDKSQILYEDSDRPQALDFNYCSGQQKIYWTVLHGEIRRGNPDGGGEFEHVTTDDVVSPRGIAVDYMGNNVYFSQKTEISGNGRLEVVTCDGRYRKVLRSKLNVAGPLTLDITRGYLYYADGFIVYRIDTDGDNNMKIITADDEITGLAIDTKLNRLYWSYQGLVRYRDLLPGTLDIAVDTSDSVAHGLSAEDGLLYWTVVGNASVPGAIYSLNPSDSNSLHVLHRSMDIHPRDISTAPPDALSDEGCATDNGGCDQFCFSVPSGDGGTVPQCGCSTGIRLHTDPTLGMPTCPTVPDRFLLYGQILTNNMSRISMISLDADSNIPVPVPFQVSGMGAYFVAYDHRDHRVYWNEVDPPAIKRAAIDSRDQPEVFITTSIRSVSGLAVDTFSRNLYWTDSVLDRIEVASISSNLPSDYGDRKVLVEGDIHQPQSLALDPIHGYMYWVDLDSDRPRIERARLDGSERMQIFTEAELGFVIMPTFLTVDNGTVYWTDSASEGHINTGYTARNHPNGRGVDIGATHVHGLAVLDDGLYWTDGFQGQIGMATIRGNEIGSSLTFMEHVVGIQGIVAVDTNHQVETPCDNIDRVFQCSHLCLTNGSNTHVCACPDGLQFEAGSNFRCTDPLGYAVVAVTEDFESRIDLYYRSVHSHGEDWNYRDPEIVADVVAMAIHVLDSTSSNLYYISASDQWLYRRHISNVSMEEGTPFVISEATPIITCCLAKPEDLAVDWLGSNLYWTDSERGVIEVSQLDGGSRGVLYSDLYRPSVLELDPRRGLLFYISRDSPSIHYLRMDGTSLTPTTLCTSCTVASSSDIGAVIALSVVYDPTPNFKDELVWSYSRSSGMGTVSGSYQLSDLTQPATLLLETESIVYTAMLYFDKSLYYSVDFEGVTKVNVSKDVVTSIFEDELLMITDFTIAHHSRQPGFHECSSTELCSGHNPLCLVRDHIHGHCSCPIDTFKDIGSDINGIERDSCIQSTSFIMWATANHIYYYSLPTTLSDTSMTSEPHIIPRHHHGDVVAVTYDPRNERVVWMNGDTMRLHSVSIHGTESEIMGRFPDHVRPESMSLDWIGGQVLFTEGTGYQIEAASIRGDHEVNLTISSVVSTYGEEGVVSPYQPRSVVFDERDMSLLWHEEGREIFRTALGEDRTDYTPLLTFNEGRSIVFLTFDPAAKYVYWWNELGGAIEGFRVTKEMNTNDVEVEIFVQDVTHITGLSSNTISVTASFIFWYDRSDEAFYRCNVSRKLEDAEFECREKQFDWSLAGEEMVAMVSFDRDRASSDAISATYACRSGAECDYLCVERSGRATCVCPLFRGEEEGGQCSDINCTQFHTSCQDGLECFANTYSCDNIHHCTNGFDEQFCTRCDDPHSIPCGPGDEGVCYPNTSRCDGILDCPVSNADELLCCHDFEFGCYSVVDEIYMCFPSQRRCESDPLCLDRTDQESCTPSNTNTPNPSTPSPSNGNPVVIAIVTVISLIVTLFLVVVVIMTLRCAMRLKTRQHRIHFPMLSKTGSSPAPRSDISSIYSGMSSLGTESTNFGNCSSPHTDSFGKAAVFHPERSTHISNPPPSLITRRQSQGLEEEGHSYAAQSFLMSEVDPCPAPNPSVDWDNMSALSFSASQRGVRMNGGGNYYRNRRPLQHQLSSRTPQAENPLHYHHTQNHHAPTTVGFRGNSHVYHGNGNVCVTNNSVVSDNSRRGQQCPPPTRLMGGPHERDLPNYDDAETETMFSQSTINTDTRSRSVFPYEDRTPPGRPPSPATITEYSEHWVPISPKSEFSVDEEAPESEQQI